MRLPNLFILGAPKCGTTSLAHWLAAHPQVFLASPKEPMYFDRDFKSSARPISETKYRKLFEGATKQHIAIGEATVNYLQSREAVPRILDFSPQARFVVCLRNPVRMAPSLHAQFVKNGMEVETHFERAWRLQNKRAKGESVPITCPDPKYLLYGRTCLLGRQMERLFSLVARERVLVVFLSEMSRDPAHEYRRVLEFLGLEDDYRTAFPVKNPRAVPRRPWVSQALRAATSLKLLLGIRRGTGLGAIIHRWNNQKTSPARISGHMQATLCRYFEDDIRTLGRVLNKDLSAWSEVETQ